MQRTIKSFHEYGDRRIEIELNDSTKLTFFINSENELQLLCNEPGVISKFIPNEGFTIKVDYYGHPYGD